MDIFSEYFPNLTQEQISKLNQLAILYKFWNNKINIVSRKDIDNISINHILHSLAIAKQFKFTNNDTVLDIGTGGGLPGIPLAIVFPETKFHLIDSIAKKIKVVNAIKTELSLKNVTEEQLRVEKSKISYNYLVSRAVTNFSDFVKLSKKSLIRNKSSKIIYLKGGDFSNEIAAFKNRIEIFNISDFFTESFFETKKIIAYSPYSK